MDSRLWASVARRFLKSDISGAIEFLEERLAKEKGVRFKGLLRNGFTNKPRSVLTSINKFIDACSKEFAIKAVYLEMNGFDINPKRWYFDSFGFVRCGSTSESLDWLCDWQSPNWPPVTLTGLEDVQLDFEWYHAKEIWRDKKFTRQYDLAVLLVLCKFLLLIELALAAGKRSRPLPLLATAHDFDTHARFEADYS